MQMSSSSANTGAGAAGSVAPSDPNTANQNWPGCFRHVARCRRLNKEEVVLILSDPLKFGLVRTEVLPPEGIASGTVYLCSKDRVRVLKHDGIDYVKRNAAQGSNRIREDVVKMKVNGRHAVNSYSSRGAGSACFWRRRYALEPPAPANGASGSRGRGQQNVTWGDQLVHYLDDEEARGFARRSPFGAAGVARPLTSEECWRGRGAQLPPDGDLFLPPNRRESRREDPLSLPAPAPPEKPLPSLPASVKQEQAQFRANNGAGSGGGSNGNAASAAGRGPWSNAVPKGQSVRRYATQADLRAAVPAGWNSTTDVYGMDGNGNVGDGTIVSVTPSPANRLGVAAGSGTSGAVPTWELKKSDLQQSAGLSNPTGIYDELGGLEFEGFGMGDMNGGGNASADDDMSDLFRSFLVDGDDILTASGGTGMGHSGGSGNQTGGTSVDLAQPPGFGLRVGGCAPGMRISGQDAEAVGATLIRRRCNTSPDLEDTGGAGGSQRSSMAMLPALVGSPPRRPEPPLCGNTHHSNLQNNNSGSDTDAMDAMESDNPPRALVPSHGRGTGGGGVPVATASTAAAASTVTAAGDGGEACGPPVSLQLGSWSDSYGMASNPATVSSTTPGAHEVGSSAVSAAASPSGPAPGGMGNGVTIVDFSPTWDFSPGGAKLLICLAAPIDADPGSVGPIVFFSDRPVQSEVVSQTVLRCRVPPGPGPGGTGRIPIRVEGSSSVHGAGRLDQSASATGTGGAGGGVNGRNMGPMSVGLHFFEYRSPANSPSSATSALSRNGTPRVSTPGKRLTWQEAPEDPSKLSTSVTTTNTTTTRKRDWKEVVTSSAPPPPLEAVYSSPVSCSWADRGRVWGTPRASESSPWGVRGLARTSSSASNGRRGQRHMWRRASGDFETAASTAARQTEDSLGYPPMACDGRECKIRIVERLGEISGARASSMASESQHVYSGGGAGGARASTSPACPLTSVTGGPGAQGTRGGASSTCRNGVHESWSSCGVVGSESSSMSCVSTSGGTGEGSSIVVGAGGLGGLGSTGIVAARGGNDLGQHLALDDTALNELGDAELEVLLEQMWMKVMGQLTDLESELNELDARGFSVLHYTCLHSLSELVPVLLDRGANVNLRTGDGRKQTPLHLAAIGGSLRIVQELMRRGANVDAVDDHGLTPDKLAMRCNKREVGLYLWGQTRGTGVRGGGGQSGTANGTSSNGARASDNASPVGAPVTPTPKSTPHVRQGSPGPLPPWGGGVSPAGCPPPLWCESAQGGGVDNWQGQLSPSPETPNERLSVGGGSPPPPPPSLSGALGDNNSLSEGVTVASPATAPAPAAAGTDSPDASGLNGASSSGVEGDSNSIMGQINLSWISSTARASGKNSGRGLEGRDIMGGEIGEAGAGESSGPWGLGLPPPGGTDKATAPGGRPSGSTERLDLVTMDEGGSVNSEEAGADVTNELDGEKGSSTEQFLAEAFSTLSLHEKCALHLHVSSLQQEQQQQQHNEAQAGAGDAESADESSGNRTDLKTPTVDLAKLTTSMSNVLAKDEGGLRATDMRTIIDMMGPSDLSELEDEVKVIQTNVRAWILRCNYKSLRKAARTLQDGQAAWRERSKKRHAEVATHGTSSAPSSPLSVAGDHKSSSNSLALSAESMDDGCSGSGVTGDVSGPDTPPRMVDETSGISSESITCSSAGLVTGSDTNAGRVSLNLGSEEERSRREERAAKALQTAARVMLARRGRFQRLARETSALLVIQKRSRDFARQKQQSW